VRKWRGKIPSVPGHRSASLPTLPTPILSVSFSVITSSLCIFLISSVIRLYFPATLFPSIILVLLIPSFRMPTNSHFYLSRFILIRFLPNTHFRPRPLSRTPSNQVPKREKCKRYPAGWTRREISTCHVRGPDSMDS